MEAIIEAIFDGLKKFAGEIIAALLLTLALWAFPSLRSLFRKDKGSKENEAEIQKALEIYQALHKQEEEKKAEEEKRKAEIQRELELKRKEEERLRAELQQREEALRLAEAQKAEETKRRAEIEKELEAKRREEALKQPEAHDSNKLIGRIIFCAAFIILIAIVVFPSLKSSFTKGGTENQQQISQVESTNEPTDAKAQFELGDKYYDAKNYEQAVYWFRKAAEQRYADAQFNLGWMYEYGQGVKQDYGEAVKWYRLAAEQGHAPAQYNLGLMYEYGKGVKKDYSEALKWYRKAAEQGDSYAKDAAERVQKLMR